MQTLTVSSEKVNATADLLHDFLANQHTTTGVGVASLALALGRLMAPRDITKEEEIKFMNDALDWVGLYWSGLDEEAN